MSDALFRMFLEEVPPEMTKAAMKIMVDRLDLTPEKLALMFIRQIHPDAHLTNEEEGLSRGLDRKTVGKLKARGEIK